jgi:hypothetical protein
MVLASFSLINNMNENNTNILSIIKYIIKCAFLGVSYNHKDKISKELMNYFMEYSLFTEDNVKYFDNDSYNIYTNNKIIKSFFS